ncbi:MAG: methyltransferase type 11 [Alphaproteobacteria bacterium]|nr:methyltransferase type 11 [Alphaproteobacteria bacterium]|tara:strand:- start:1117 stop:1797 length:681 start_codon:yes stop_codon:yes gene_type:complete
MSDNQFLVLADSTVTVLAPHLYRRQDLSDDEMFYAVPRLVTHINDGAINALSGFYASMPEPGTRVLDLMSSCVSHLPNGVAYEEVVGLGMNHAELKANPQLSRYVVHNLNRDPRLPFGDQSFDACLIAVSIQYLVRPAEVFRDVGRVLKAGAPMIVSYSNRLFPTKAVMIWQMLDNEDHGHLVAHYFETSGCFGATEVKDLSPDPGVSDPLFVVVGRRSATQHGLE